MNRCLAVVTTKTGKMLAMDAPPAWARKAFLWNHGDGRYESVAESEIANVRKIQYGTNEYLNFTKKHHAHV